jgi:hypothetical protein
MRTSGVFALLVVASLLLPGCSRETIRQATYGPSFQYIPKERLQETMWGLARAVRELDETLAAPDDDLPGDRQPLVAGVLDEMGELAARISAPGQATNQHMIDMNLDRFQVDLALARTAIDRDPPDYAPAKRVATACLHCHQGTGGGPLKR